MKLRNGSINLATLSLLGFLAVACNSGGGGSTPVADRYAEGLETGKKQGYTEGYDVGYDDGYADGDVAGYERAKVFFSSADYLKGFADGKAEGITIGYGQGYTVGKTDGTTQGYNSGYAVGKTDGKREGYDLGYDDGYDDGHDDGYASGDSGAYTTGYNAGYSKGTTDGKVVGYNLGYDDGNADGYDSGYDDGSADGYDLGYDDGMSDGYDIGYDDGFDDGYGLSVGKSKSLKGYANVISMFHNDLVDYKKIQAPKETKRGLVANGRLLFSETSVTNKDTLKRTAAVEQYLVVEMAKQVKGKFGLSAERSLKVAKAANHFRKYSSKRALTAEDTNAYAAEIIGADFNQITKAYESGMKGDLSSFNAVMEKAAKKNETSPEKMAEIVTKLFI
jgi:flagellar biosynthesis/type III secretory pathway protein FliH